MILRVPETRACSSRISKKLWYWRDFVTTIIGSVMARGLLERVFNEVLISNNKPDFPFCLAWANQTWTGIWHGAPDKVLVEQEYPGEKDWVDHFFTVLPAFNDKRYIRINGKPLFVIYKPSEMSDLASFVKCWQCLAHDNGLDAIYFIGITSVPLDKEETGLDGITSQPPGDLIGYKKTGVFDSLLKKFTDMTKEDLVRKYLNRPEVYDYEMITKIENYERLTLRANNTVYPCVMPNWDNTPRSGTNGIVLKNSTPEKFASNLKKAINFIETYESEEKIIFIKSWNEWLKVMFSNLADCGGMHT